MMYTSSSLFLKEIPLDEADAKHLIFPLSNRQNISFQQKNMPLKLQNSARSLEIIIF